MSATAAIRLPSAPAQTGDEKRIHVVQGEYAVSQDEAVMLTTVLGSCVAACIHDPVARIGGMNHFLLPEGTAGDGVDGLRYGAYAMELLVNGLLQRGARRERLTAKLFGGARMIAGLSDVGTMNANFAQRYLAAEGISFGASSLRGDRARRIQFWPVSGRARQMLLGPRDKAVFKRELQPSLDVRAAGDIELF